MKEYTKLITKLSITYKLWGGFGIVLAILVLVVSNTLFSLSHTEEKVVTVTEEVQPTLISSMELMTELKEAASSLGLFLLTKEEEHKTNYHNHLTGIDKKLQALKDSPVAQKNSDTQSILADIEEKVVQFKSYEPRMIQLVEIEADNFPPLRFASDEINPLNTEIVLAMSNMVQSEGDEKASENRKRLFIDMQNLRYTWTNVVTNIRIYITTGNLDMLSNVRLFIEGAMTLTKKIATEYDGMLTFEQEEAIAVLQEKLPAYAERLGKLEEIFKAGKARTDALLIRTEIAPLLTEIDTQLKDLVSQQRNNIQTTSTELIDQVSATTGLVTTLLIIGLLIGGGIAWITARLISLPLKNAAAAMKNIAEGEGDLTQRLSARGEDEIAQLAQGFNHFAANIQELLGKILKSADQISNASESMATASRSAEENIRLQNAETEQISSAIEEMSMNSQEVAQNAELAADAARNADKETSSGREIVTNALQAVGELADETQAAADVIEKLGNDIHGISSVIDMIRSIAEQTNLLALNAAIEAARAGEQGRGFAVVADEVRTLASRTAQSTQEIQDKVETLQKDAQSAVTKMLQNRAKADSTIALTTTAGESLEAITSAVEHISEMSNHIANAANQQSSVASVVSQNIAAVSQLAQKTDDSTQQVFQGTNDLGLLTAALRDHVSRFKV